MNQQTTRRTKSTQRTIYYIYDGECPLCQQAALALRIQQDYGELKLINARENKEHVIVKQINELGLDMDEGMVIYDEEQFYHGHSALNFMAKYSETKGIFNLLGKSLYWSETLAKVTYPWLRGIRNWLVRRKNVSRIDNLNLQSEPIFKSVFGDDWDKLPTVMHKHYANRPYTSDSYSTVGKLNVMCAGPIKVFAPIFWLLGGIPPHNENNVPITVNFKSDKNTKAMHFDRVFRFNSRKHYRFHSRMVPVKGNEMIEVMKFGIGWKMQIIWQDQKVKLIHKGYVFNLFGHFIPLPLNAILGSGYAEETAVDENTFDMFVKITHPLWGKIYQYDGRFTMREDG